MTKSKLFRRKVTYTNATQFLVDGPRVEGVMVDTDCNAYVITAHEQRAYLADGDWVIPEATPDRFYPCKPDIFEATYEPANEGEPIAPDAQKFADDYDRQDEERFLASMRNSALEFAIENVGEGGRPSEIVKAARIFAAFLEGQPETDVVAELKPTLVP